MVKLIELFEGDVVDFGTFYNRKRMPDSQKYDDAVDKQRKPGKTDQQKYDAAVRNQQGITDFEIPKPSQSSWDKSIDWAINQVKTDLPHYEEGMRRGETRHAIITGPEGRFAVKDKKTREYLVLRDYDHALLMAYLLDQGAEDMYDDISSQLFD